LEGVTGSIPGGRTDIDEIIKLKTDGVHFDLLIVPSIDRFTRAGQGHGAKMFWDLEAAGIVTYFVAENLFSDDRMHRYIISFMLDAAQQFVVSNTRSSLLGNTNSFLDGRSPHCRIPIYGLDRMYSVDGKDVHRMRSLPDGTQQMLNPAGDEILRRFGKNVKGKSPEHYVKQKNEDVRLVPGDPQHVGIVHTIYELVYVQRRSFHSIAKHFNDSGKLSPRGKQWEGDAIKSISLNPTYLGILRLGKTTEAIYYKTAVGSPAPSDVTIEELRDSSGRVRTRARPAEEWLLREDPELRAFLPKHLDEVARPVIEAHMREEGKAKPLRPLNKDRHRNSDFFLKYILKSKQGGHRMTGKSHGRNGEKRSYRVPLGQRCPLSGNVLNRAINATALEKEMLNVLREVLLSKPDLKETLRRAAADHVHKDEPLNDHDQIEKTLKKRQKQIAVGMQNLTGEVELDRPIEAKLAEYREDVMRLRTARRLTPTPKMPINIDAAADQLAAELADFGSNLDGKDFAIIHEMFGLLVHKMEADLVTKEIDISLAIPDWMGSAMGENGMMSLVGAFACRTPNEAHYENALILAEYRCQKQGHQHVCYDCQRVRKAA